VVPENTARSSAGSPSGDAVAADGQAIAAAAIATQRRPVRGTRVARYHARCYSARP